MRQDQFERLQSLSERLTDVFLDEANPDQWPGAGMSIAAMDKDTRGDRYWSKKNAAATITLMQRIMQLSDVIRAARSGDAPDPEADPEIDLEKEIATAEREAERLLDQVQASSRKAAFDKRVRGKR
jgi:hypothetical protein